MKRPATIGIAVIGVMAFLSVWWAIAEGPLRSPKAALHDFYEAEERAEDQLMDPLILAGKRVAPIVITEIKNKKMEKRRYAIGFLGNGRYVEALPALEIILKDDTEIDYFRADALQAIYQISRERAEELAPIYVRGEGLLGRVSNDIISGKNPVYFERSYSEAFWHVHH